jgi:hypothetical protein
MMTRPIAPSGQRVQVPMAPERDGLDDALGLHRAGDWAGAGSGKRVRTILQL